MLDQCLLLGMQRMPPALLETTHAFSHSLFSQLSRFVAAQARDRAAPHHLQAEAKEVAQHIPFLAGA